MFFEVPEVIKQSYMAKLTYMLTAQFIDSTSMLQKFAVLDHETYKIDAIAELNPMASVPKVGNPIYPAGISNHK